MGEEYVQGVREMKAVIESVEPDFIVIEEFYFQAVDACIVLGGKFWSWGPGTFREHASNLESLWVKMTKYPALVVIFLCLSMWDCWLIGCFRKASGYTYPLPRRRKPANLYLNFRLMHKFLTSSHLNPITEARKKGGMNYKFPGLKSYEEKVTYILPATPESDFPCPVPSNIVCCGPIILPSAPLSTVDPDLDAWLQKGPTVLLSLGSSLRTSIGHAQELAIGIQIFLDENTTHQVLWKLKTDETRYESVLQVATKILSKHLESG
jgi:hypothetical protein